MRFIRTALVTAAVTAAIVVPAVAATTVTSLLADTPWGP